MVFVYSLKVLTSVTTSKNYSVLHNLFVQPLPDFSRIPGLILPGHAVSDCLMLMQFLRGFGKVLGLDLNADVPTLGMLQEGLLNVGDSMGQVQDLLVKLLSLTVCDPGLPPGQKVSWFMLCLCMIFLLKINAKVYFIVLIYIIINQTQTTSLSYSPSLPDKNHAW